MSLDLSACPNPPRISTSRKLRNLRKYKTYYSTTQMRVIYPLYNMAPVEAPKSATKSHNFAWNFEQTLKIFGWKYIESIKIYSCKYEQTFARKCDQKMIILYLH